MWHDMAMKKLFLPVALLALLVAGPVVGQATGKLPEWLAGTWQMEDGAAWADEVWSPSRGGMMVGAGRMGFGPNVENWEIMRIQRRADGAISYFAQPKGGAAVEFPMVTVSDGAVEFANPAHDYPQRIRYWREGQLLMAEISRIDGSDAVRWNYRPVARAED